ncbi:protocadherin Fat 2-like [Saccoglossus kowalevskii]
MMMITSHFWSMYILLGLLLTLEVSVTETTLQIHDGQHSMDKTFQLNILENIVVGKVIFVLNHSSWLNEEYTLHSDVYFHIYEGNKRGRFAVDSQTGQISVAGYLDYDIDPMFRLKVRCQNCEHSYEININVENVSSWPTVYNETCAIPSRSSSISDSWVMPLKLYLDKEKTPLEIYFGRNALAPLVEGYMDNSECTMVVFFEFRDVTLKLLYNMSEIHIKCDGLDSIASFTIHFYEDKVRHSNMF